MPARSWPPAARRPTPAATTDELELALDGLLRLDGVALADVDAISLASVVPALTGAVEAIAVRRDRQLLVAGPGTVPLAVRVDRPGDVGADRLVNALAAGRLYGTPAVVVDFGTATTLDCVAADGAYVGGAIAPGSSSGSRRSRHGPPSCRGSSCAPRTGRSGATRSARCRAARSSATRRSPRACSSASARELADANDTTPAQVKAILTGGLSAAPWARALEGIDAIDPELTLKGLAILHAEVGGGEPLELGLR